MSNQSMRSKWLQLHDPIPEMELQDLVKLAKAYLDLDTLLEDKPYKVRFIASPGNPFHPESRAIVIPAHHRGKLVDSVSIQQLLAKFEISKEKFCNAYNLYFGAKENPSSESEPIVH
jgi:hypothetical protein